MADDALPASTPAPDSPEDRPPLLPDAGASVLGLDPRGLLAGVARQREADEVLRAWTPPTVAEMTGLFPQFEVLEFIGRGGMGAVYRARQPALDRLVAIKLLPVEAAADDAFARRFQTEARALARLQHPQIVAIHEFGQTHAGHLFFVMEYVEGNDLAGLLRDGVVAPARAVEILRAVCAALYFAHEHGLVHRDIKPSNVLIGHDGVVKVADFGIAHGAEGAAGTSRLTLTGAALGTPDYMAPEQRAGGEIDARADIYSAGVMLYELLTGRLPHGAWEPPSSVTQADPRLDALVQHAIQNDPAKRFQSVQEMIVQLERAAVAPPIWKRPRGRVAIGLLALAAALAGGWYFRPADPANADPAPGLDLLRGLDLPQQVFTGTWSRQEDAVVLEYSEPANRLRLPVRPAGRAYDLSFEVWLDQGGSDAAVILPVGATGVAVILDYRTRSGLHLVKQVDWNKNPTTKDRELPVQRFLPVKIAVRPGTKRASVEVWIEGASFITWSGPSSDLSLHREAVSPATASADEWICLASYAGGVRFRAVKVKMLP